MKSQTVLSLAVTFVETLLYSGLLYGWSSLQPVLVQEGFFNDTDSDNDAKYFGYFLTTDTINTDQINRLMVVFTIASTVAPICNLSTGYMLDRLGGWFTRTYCLVVMAAGLVLCSVATPETSNLLFASFSLISYAGLGLNSVNVQVANLLPKYKSSLCTVISGLYDSSTLVFLVFNKLYKGGSSYHSIFFAYAFVSVPFHFYTFLLTPKRVPPEKIPENYKYGYHELPCAKRTEEQTAGQNYKRFDNTNEKEDDAVDLSFKECLKLPYTWTNILHSCVLQLSMAFFIGNFNFWLTSSFPDATADQIEKYTTVFGTVQCCGVFFAPISGALMDFLRQKFAKIMPLKFAALKSAAVSILMSSLLTILMFVFSLVPVFEVQIVTFVLQALARSIICGTLVAFLNIVYPNKHYGKMYGIHIFVCGVTLLLQYPLTLVVTNLLGNSFTAVNAALLVCCVASLAHPFYILYYVKKSMKLENSLLGGKTKHEKSSAQEGGVKESDC